MPGAPSFDAFLFLAAVIVLIVATARHVHPFVALVAVGSAFGLAAGFSISLLGKTFGAGFSQAIYSPGLVIVGAGFVAGLAESTVASDRLSTAIDYWRWLGSTRIAASLGLIAGIGASPAAAFALLTPVLRAIGGSAARGRESVAVALALAISASHGLVLLTPVPIAAAAILDAGWGRVAGFGLPLAVLMAGLGAALARWLPGVGAGVRDSPQALAAEPPPPSANPAGGSALALVLATAIPLLLLMEQSLGDIPSEPLGGGTDRELIIGVGRPLILFLVAVGIMTIGQWRASFKLFTDPAWTDRILGNLASVVLVVGAAGGVQKLCQETGMSELLGERLLSWHGGLLVPFAIAALIKTLQGSSLVAAITAAGMVQPMLLPLGLGDENGKALATLAIGAGAMTVSQINDEYFWLVTSYCGYSPLRGLATLSFGTLLQGFAAIALLLIFSVFIALI
jgi:GntP family gluconate:H+ symporter